MSVISEQLLCIIQTLALFTLSTSFELAKSSTIRACCKWLFCGFAFVLWFTVLQWCLQVGEVKCPVQRLMTGREDHSMFTMSIFGNGASWVTWSWQIWTASPHLSSIEMTDIETAQAFCHAKANESRIMLLRGISEVCQALSWHFRSPPRHSELMLLRLSHFLFLILSSYYHGFSRHSPVRDNSQYSHFPLFLAASSIQPHQFAHSSSHRQSVTALFQILQKPERNDT